MHRLCLAVCLCLAAALGPAATPAAAAPDGPNRVQYKVLVFTKATAEQHASTAAGAEAIKALGKEHRFVVQVTNKTDRFNDEDLASYRVIVFLNTSGDVLSDEQQAVFERWFKNGGGFLGFHSAIETEPDWTFLSDILGTRATGQAELDEATIKVADRVHDASRTLPERWVRSDRFYNFSSNVRGRFHVLATVDETTYTGGTMDSIIRTPGAKTRRAGARSTRRAATPPRRSPRRTSASTSPARSTGPRGSRTRTTRTAARPCWPTTSR